MFETLGLVWSALWERRGRTIGAIIGVVIAFTALTFALSVGNYFRESALSFFGQLGINNLFVVGTFTQADVALMRVYAAPYSTAVVPISMAFASVRLPNGKIASVNLYGVPKDYVSALVPQTSIYEGSNSVGGSLAVVGYGVAFDQNTGAQLLDVGFPIPLAYGGRSFTLVVSGIILPGQASAVNTLNAVIIDDGLFRSITGTTDYSLVIITLKDTAYIDKVQSLIKAAFPNAQVVNLASLVQTINQFFTGLELFLGLVSGVSTVITALWLYDTMTISVIQRTKEFGILRAIGFKRRQITAMVVLEAIVVSALGVAVGAVLLVPLSFMKIGFFPGMAVSISPPLHIALGTAALVVAINALGALAPALRAGGMNLVDALRYE
mgnify:FL=1